MEWDGLLDGLFDGLFGGSSSGSGISGAWQYSLGAYASQLRGPVGYYAGLLMTSGLNLDDPSGLGYAGAQVEAEYAASHATTFDISSVGIDAPDTDLFSGRTKDTEPGQVPLPTTTDPPSDPTGAVAEHRGERAGGLRTRQSAGQPG
jgi:hypothetical protein